MEICEICSGTFSTRSNLKRHLRKVHSITPPDKEKKYPCTRPSDEIQGDNFTRNRAQSDDMKDHTRVMEPEVPSDEIQGDNFTRNRAQSDDMKDHTRVMEPEVPSDEIQGDNFTRNRAQSDDMKDHTRVMEPEVPSDEIQGDNFTRNRAQSDDMKDHTRVMEPEVPSDEIQGDNFTRNRAQSDDMKDHTRVMEPEVPSNGTYDIQDVTHKSTQPEDMNYYVKVACHACPHCNFMYKLYQDLENHLIEAHDFVMEIETLEFESREAFQSWKMTHEAATFSLFVKRSSKDNRSYYICHRSGETRCKTTVRQQWRSTLKTGKCCPARMKVIVDKESMAVKVIFHKTHAGHVQSIKHLRLSKDERNMLAGKLKNGVPFDRILDDIRNSVTSRGEMTRLHLIEKQDLRNIVREFDLDQDRAHNNDAFSVDIWVHQQQLKYGEDCPVIYYKKQNYSDIDSSLKHEDFMLVIMTKYQIEIAKEYTAEKVLIDSTHGTTAYDFQLTTIVSVDEFGAGTPIAECISNRIDTVAMAEFFKAVKNKTGVLSSEVFMTDDYQAYYNAWSEVMDTPANRLLCTWHVDRSWRNNMSKVKSQTKQSEVYRACRILMEITDKHDFFNTMDDFLRSCASDNETAEFGKYFEKHYASRPEQWAYCFRTQLGLNTNMYLEAMHKRIKHCYMNGKLNRRVDKIVMLLLRYTRDIMFEKTIRIMKNKPTYRMREIGRSHQRSYTVTDEMVKTCNDKEWLVESSSAMRGPYLILINIDENCPGCPLSCPECKVCVHQFTCTCVDYLIRAKMCKHIHACIRVARRNSPEEKTCTTVDYDEAFSKQNKMVTETLMSQPSTHIGVGVSANIKLEMILNAMLGSAKMLSNDAAEIMCKQADLLYQKMQNASKQFPKNDANANPNTLYKFNTTASSSHANIQPQRFVSTKKKTNNQNVRLSKPTELEKATLKEAMKDQTEVENVHSDFDHKYVG